MRKRGLFKKQSDQEKKESIFPISIKVLEEKIRKELPGEQDLFIQEHEQSGKKLLLFGVPYLIEKVDLNDYLLEPLLEKKINWTNEEILNEIPLSTGVKVTSFEEIIDKLLVGGVFIYVEHEEEIICYILLNKEKRGLDKAETESLVLGPKIAFTESISTNMNIIRFRIRSKDLVMEELKVGHSIPTDLRLVYMKSIANEDDVNTMRQRIEDLDVDKIEDAIVLTQYLEDSELNVFPQFEITELPDRFTYAITHGKIGVLIENSPSAIIAPATFFSFLESTEDRYMRWQSGTFFRFLRFISMFFAITVTPAYVAVVTYQYGLIPMQLLISIGQSRAQVPFPPLLEAFLLEFMIELLREAGARLPTKVGQTMGIVGGIVIGQAAVEAGLTSNILIIVVAMSALASFTSPSYLLGSSVRIIRFPLMLLAGALGVFGIMFGLCFIIIHAIRLTSLGRPYLSPLYPLQIKDFNNVFFRSPPRYDSNRMKSFLLKDQRRFSKEEAAKKQDIDE